MFSVFASNGLFEQVNLLYRYIRGEDNLQPELEDFNTLLRTLVSSGLAELAVGCYHLMKDGGCDPDRESYRILINGLDAVVREDALASIREDAVKYYGNLDFLQEHEEMVQLVWKFDSEPTGCWESQIFDDVEGS